MFRFQPSALSPQPSAYRAFSSFLFKIKPLTAVCFIFSFGNAFATAPIYYNLWDRIPVAAAELACLKSIDFLKNNPPNTYIDWSFLRAEFQVDFDGSDFGKYTRNLFGGVCVMTRSGSHTWFHGVEFHAECTNGYIVVKKDTSVAQCITQGLDLTLTPVPQTPPDPRPDKTGGKSTLVLKATVTENGSPKKDVVVNFGVEVIANSGGHDHHDATRPKGKVTPTNGVTDANGEIKVTFEASQVAGTHVVAAVCDSCSNKSVTRNVDVKVPDLVNLLSLPFRTAQWNPTGIGETANHKDNHYLTTAAIYRLLEISEKFKKIWPTAPQLTLNDASLKWGGKFDIDGSWERRKDKHGEHRLGNNIDIRANSGPGNVPSRIRDAFFRWLRDESIDTDQVPAELRIRSVNPLWENPEEVNEHFHLRLGN